MKVDTTVDPESKISDGICAGIRLDIASDFLIKGKSINAIINSNQKGASAEAAANQAVYDLIKIPSIKKTTIMLETLDHLEKISNSVTENEMSSVDVRAVGRALTIVDGQISGGDVDYFQFLQKYTSDDKKLNKQSSVEFIEVVNTYINEQKNIARNMAKGEQHPFLSRNKNQIWIISDPLKFQEGMLKEINTKFNENIDNAQSSDEKIYADKSKDEQIKTLKWTVSILQLKNELERQMETQTSAPKEVKLSDRLQSFRTEAIKVFGKLAKKDESFSSTISDPLIKHVIAKLIAHDMDDKQYSLTAHARGLELESVEDIMGHSAIVSSDDSYLKNFIRLETGVYAIDLMSGDGAHAITYVKEEDGKGYILDPNGPQLRCQTPEHALHLLKKVLTEYEEPVDKSPLYTKGNTDHQLSIKKFKKIN